MPSTRTTQGVRRSTCTSDGNEGTFMGDTRITAGLLALVLAACGADGNARDGSMADSSGASELANLTGTIEMDGSSTVYPISEAVAEEFSKAAGGKVQATVA